MSYHQKNLKYQYFYLLQNNKILTKKKSIPQKIDNLLKMPII